MPDSYGELVAMDPFRRLLALRKLGLVDDATPTPPAVAARPQVRYQYGVNRDLDHAAMRAWRERSGVSRDDHQRMRSLARGAVELVRSSGGRGALALVEGEPRRGGAGTTLHGHFAIFNAWAEIDSLAEGLFLERIAPGAFARVFREKGRGIKVLLEHGHDPVVGNKPLGAPSRLAEDGHGAAYEVPLLDTTYVRDLLLPALREGLYGASFRFRVPEGGDRWVDRPARSAHNPDAIPERTLTEIDLSEFGPVTWPAYDAATAGVA